MLFDADVRRPSLSASRSPALFESQAQTIIDGFLERQSMDTTRRAEGPNSWLKREAYHLIGHYLERDCTAAFNRLALKDRRPGRLITEAARNPFKLGLLAMFADDSILSRANRHVFGNQMLFGWAHDIPPDFLNAFLAISGGPLIVAKRLKAIEPQPEFEHRFKSDRLTDLVS